MPNYGSTTPIGLFPDQGISLFAAETPTAPQASVAIARGPSGSRADGGTTFSVSWATAPTAQLDIQAANQDVDAQYVTVSTIIAQHGAYTDVGRSKFYRARLVSQSAGGALTVIAQR